MSGKGITSGEDRRAGLWPVDGRRALLQAPDLHLGSRLAQVAKVADRQVVRVVRVVPGRGLPQAVGGETSDQAAPLFQLAAESGVDAR